MTSAFNTIGKAIGWFNIVWAIVEIVAAGFLLLREEYGSAAILLILSGLSYTCGMWVLTEVENTTIGQ